MAKDGIGNGLGDEEGLRSELEDILVAKTMCQVTTQLLKSFNPIRKMVVLELG